MKRFSVKRVLAAVCRHIFQTALRMLITFLFFGVGLMITLRYLGIPLPGADQLLNGFDGLSELARILS